jgi:hypothetical protein
MFKLIRSCSTGQLIKGFRTARGKQYTPADSNVELLPDRLLLLFSAQHITYATDRQNMAPTGVECSALVLQGVHSTALALQATGSSSSSSKGSSSSPQQQHPRITRIDHPYALHAVVKAMHT